MNHEPSFRVVSCNNALHCMSCYVISHTDSIIQMPVTWQRKAKIPYWKGGTCWKGNTIDYPDRYVRWRWACVKWSRSSHNGVKLEPVQWSYANTIYVNYSSLLVACLAWSLNDQIALLQSYIKSDVHSEYNHLLWTWSWIMSALVVCLCHSIHVSGNSWAK